jgi:endonuclease/exonuclease/phosphatase (EEP) superfamily protein YafD
VAAPINIRHHISNIHLPQANVSDCWAAATAMVMHRHSEAGTAHVQNLAAEWHVPLDKGTLPDSSVPLLARAVRLRLHDFQEKEITLHELARLLSRGPVVLFGFFNYPHRSTSLKHAVALYALHGDGTARHTTIHLMDPSSPTNPFTDDWEHFFEQVADITLALSY